MHHRKLPRHQVKAGKHDYKPGHGLGLRLSRTGFGLRFIIPASAWFDPTAEGPLGTDGKDWNKLGGVSFLSPFRPLSWLKNRNAVMIAWRPAEKEGFFEIAAYTNDRKGGHKAQYLTNVAGGFEAYANVIKQKDDKWFFQLHYGALSRFATLPAKHYPFQVNAGPWFGGNRKAPYSHYLLVKLTQ